jgi:hypothetical protein
MANFYGMDHQAHVVDVDSNSVRIDIVHPSFTLEKLVLDADGEEITDGVMVGNWVYYKITITNTGDVWLNLSIVDELLGYTEASPYIPASPLKKVGDGPAGCNVLVLTGALWKYQTQDKDIGELKNTVVVTGTDHQMHEVTHDDDVIITVYDYASVFGTVFWDYDLDGIWDDDAEPGLGDFLIELSGTDVFGVGHTYSAHSEQSTGYYGDEWLGNIIPGIYTLTSTAPPGSKWAPTTPETISNLDVTSGDSEGPHDFGYTPPHQITGYKWLDSNMNSVWDNGELPIAGIPIYLEGDEAWIREGEELTGPRHITDDTVTAADGSFSFEVYAGTYHVWEAVDTGTDTGDWYCTLPGMPENGDLYPGYHDLIITSDGEDIWCCKFGNVQRGEIGGIKFADWNMNKAKDAIEPLLTGWTIHLDGVQADGTEVHLTDVTDQGYQITLPPTLAYPNGQVIWQNWLFPGLLPGTYTIWEEMQPGWTWTIKLSYNNIVLSSGQKIEDIKFGNIPATTIWGYKFFDKNMDGIKQEIEPGLSGWTMVLWFETSPDQWTEKMRTVTGADGKYSFAGLTKAGTYMVTEELKPGWMETTSGLSHEVVVAGQLRVPVDTRFDIGNMRYTTLEGYKFLDEDLDGLFDASESGLGNWKITLIGQPLVGDPRDDFCPTSDELGMVGYYAFTDLLPGHYILEEDLVGQGTGWRATWTSVYEFDIVASLDAPIVRVYNFGNIEENKLGDPAIPFFLVEGWNLWSTPVQVEGLTAANLLAEIGDAGFIVIELDGETGDCQTFVRGDDPMSAYNFPIEMGKGYYIYATSDANFVLLGLPEATSQIALNDGWTLIGYNDIEYTTASNLLTMTSPGCYALIVIAVDENGDCSTYVRGDGPGDDFAIIPGKAYYVYSIGSGYLTCSW